MKAFTNTFGPSYQEEIVKSSIAYTDEPVPRDKSFVRVSAYNDKWPYTKGDRFSPNGYKRTIINLEEERPLLQVVPPGAVASYGWSQDVWLSAYEPLANGWRYDNIAPEEANARSASRTKALLKLADGKATFAVDLAEAKESVDMLAGSVKNVAQALLDFKRGNYKSIPARFGLTPGELLSGKFAADVWLQFQYGWKPLYKQIASYMELSQEKMDRPLYLHGKSTQVGSATQTFEQSFGKIESTGAYRSRVKTHYCAKISDSFLANANRFGVLNPATVVWELVPYSFVVDWFVPVGNYLEALSATAGLDFVWGYESTTLDVSMIQRFTPYAFPSGHIVQEAKRKILYRKFERTPFGGFQLPELYAKANPFSSSHVASAVSLIRQLF